MEPTFLIIDLFCGAGGTTTGFAMTGGISKVIACVNHDAKAIESHWANHPEVLHFEEDIRTLDLRHLVSCALYWKNIYPEAKLILWASLECTNFSKAKGGQPRDADSRTLADHLHRYVEALHPDYVQIENVVEFMSWGPLDDNGKPVSRRNGRDFLRWCNEMCAHGYINEWHELNSADFGAYTSRNRLFGIFARPGLPIVWPEATHAKKVKPGMFGQLKPWMAVKEVLDFSDEGESIFTRKKPLSEKTLERIYAGLVKYVAGGKENFLAKIYAVASNSHGTYNTESAAHTLTTRDAHALVQPSFLSKYNGGNAWHRNKSIDGPCDTVITRNAHALVQVQYMIQYNGGTPEANVFGTDRPMRTITTGHGAKHNIVQASFIQKYYSGKPDGKVISVDAPAGTICCADTQALVNAQFISTYNGNGANTSVENPAPTICTADNQSLVQPQFFIDKQYTGNGNNANHQSIDQPAGTILANDKHCLVDAQPFLANYHHSSDTNSVDNPCPTLVTRDKLALIQSQQFIMPTNYDNTAKSVDGPAPTITASRKHHYIVNPSHGGHSTSTEAPCPVIVARQDKAPLYVVISDSGDIAIRADENDTDCMKLIKEFMVLYKIVDIKMRMLKVVELLRIQGFPTGYKLAGNQSDQKKFIGNSVVPHVVKAWALALHYNIIESQVKVA